MDVESTPGRAAEAAPVATTMTSHWAVAVAAAVSLVASFVWYAVFGGAWLTLRGIDPSSTNTTPDAGVMVAQFVRNLVVAFVLAVLLKRLGTTTVSGALGLGMLVWFGFEAMAIVGSVLHEQYPVGLYAIHAGDALLATLLMTLVLGLSRRRTKMKPYGRDRPRARYRGPVS
jgi:hypothetical protein